jgi:hypothetical protein
MLLGLEAKQVGEVSDFLLVLLGTRLLGSWGPPPVFFLFV